MPSIARTALLQRLRKSGALDRLQADFTLATGVALTFLPQSQAVPLEMVKYNLAVPFVAGTHRLGVLVGLIPEKGPERQALHRLLALALESLGRDLLDPTHSSPEVVPALVERASRTLRERFQEEIRFGRLAAELGVSRERLSRLFHSTMGITLSDYLNRVRLEHCRRMLSNPETRMVEVAFASGFQSLSQFNRRFKASEGMTPSEYQRRHAVNDKGSG